MESILKNSDMKNENMNLNSTQMLTEIHGQVGSMHKALFTSSNRNASKSDEERLNEMKAKLIMKAVSKQSK